MLIATDAEQNYGNIKYIYDYLIHAVTKLGGEMELNKCGGRANLFLELDENKLKYVIPFIEDKACDTIAVNYKYNFIKEKLHVQGLNELEFELLICSLISADFNDDKRYIRHKIKNSKCYSIDGAFLFTMKPLKEKWAQVIEYMPRYFAPDQLKDFISYLIKDMGEKRVFVDNGKVYDSHFNRLKRTCLIGGGGAEILKEIILSSCGEVELSSKIDKTDEFYLKEFFGDKIFFSSSYFT